MNTIMLPQAARTPSRLGMPAHRYAPVSLRGTGSDVRDRATTAVACLAQDIAGETRAWSPPTS